MKNDTLDDLIVVKRSGQRVKFNASKIAIAIKKAFENTYDEVNENDVFKIFAQVLTYINDNYKERKTISVEDVQDIIENILNNNFNEVYLTFTEYRKKRSASRQVFNERQQHKFVKAIEKVQNYDKSGNNLVPYQMVNKFGKIISNEYAKSYLLDNKYVRLFEEGNIFIHDLDYFSLGLFSHYSYKIDHKNRKEISDVLLEIKSLEKEIDGVVYITEIDLKFKVFIINEYKKILKNDLKKHLILFGLLEFVNFKKYEDTINKIVDVEDVSILEQFKINDTLKMIIDKIIINSKDELRLYIEKLVHILFKTMINSNIKFNINLSYENNFISLEFKNSIIKYLNKNDRIENIIVLFKLIPEKEIIDLIIDNKNIMLSNENHYSDGIKLENDGQLVIASTSINLARLGLKFQNKDKNLFYEELDQILDITKNELLLVFEHIGNKTKNNYQILFNSNVLDDEKLDGNQKIRKVIKSGILNVGLIGIMECINITKLNIYELLEFIKNKLDIYSEENKVKFNLFEPNDIKSRKYLMGIDKSIYGLVKDVTDKDYYLTIDNYITDYHEYLKLAKYFDGNIKYNLILPKNTSNKKLAEMILDMKNVTVVRIKVGKK